MSKAGYLVERVETEPGLRALQESWTALTARVPDVPLFLTWEWLSTWWRYHHNDGDLWLLTAYCEKSSELAGIAPLMLVWRSFGPFSVRAVSFLFYRPPIHQDIIAVPGEKEVVWQAFIDYLVHQEKAWDVLILDGLRQGDVLKPYLKKTLGRYQEREAPVNHIITLPNEWRSYQMNCLSAKRRQQIRRARRKLEGDYPGQVVYERVRDKEALRDALGLLVTLNRKRWHQQGIRSSFDDVRFTQFNQEMAPLALERNWLRFYQLKVAGEVAALRYGFRYGDVFYAYQTTFNLDWATYRPGELLLAHAVREAIEEGMREFDLLRYSYEWKRSWATETRYESHLAASNSWRGYAWSLGARLFDAAQAYGRANLSEATRRRINRSLSSVRRAL